MSTGQPSAKVVLADFVSAAPSRRDIIANSSDGYEVLVRALRVLARIEEVGDDRIRMWVTGRMIETHPYMARILRDLADLAGGEK